MGSTHTRRNKRGGRHNRGGAPRPPAANQGASASLPPHPSETPAPAAPPERPAPPAQGVSDAPTPPRRVRGASEPSLRAPYAPGQRASRGHHRSAPAEERQPAELEVTATYEEVVVITQGVAPQEDAENEQDLGYARAADDRAPAGRDAAFMDTDVDQNQEHPAQRHNGHTPGAPRRHSHLRDRDGDRDGEQSYTPAHLRPAFEHDGTHAELEPGSPAEAGRDASDFTPRGDVRGDVGPLIDDLKAIFQHDRATASATGGTRCGICYLHYALDALEYRDDEGYYVCARCAQALGAARVPMVRRQKRS